MSLEIGQYLENAVGSSASATAFTSTGDKLIFAPTRPIEVIRFGFLFTVAGGSGSLVSTLESRPTIGSDSGRVASIASITVTAASATVKSEHTLDVTPLSIAPGQEVIVKVGTALTSAGSGIVFVHYRPRAFQTGSIANVTKH